MHFANAKGILSANNTMNIFRGCSHGCIYCDSRSACYHIDHAFEDIEVKENALELLEDALRRRRTKGMIHTGSMCDPYIHAETALNYTRRSLEIIEKYGFGVTVLTKSDRILRDIDLYDRINRRTKAVVQFTLTTMDPDVCKMIEPNVSGTQSRIEALKAFRDRNIPTVVWLCPILPFINDTEANIRGIVDACADAGVKGIITFGMGLTLREGNREYFYQQLDKRFPGMKQKYVRHFGNSYECPSPYEGALMTLFKSRCAQHGILSDRDALFAYLHTFETEAVQLSLFDRLS